MRVWVLAGFYASGRERKLAGKTFSKIFFFPAFACVGKKKLHRAVQNGTVQFFFFEEKKKNLGVTQKWVMTVAPLFTMLAEQRLCVVSL
jgi:hypothetical protein